MFWMLDRLVGLFAVDMGIDLGTANTLVCVPGKGVILSEPSVVAVHKGTNKVLLDGQAVGDRAKEMLGRTPSGIEAIRPMKDGVIADFEICEAMLRYFIQKVQGNRRFLANPRVVIAVPSGITPVEKQAVVGSAERAGARKVYLIEEPMAGAIGIGLPVAGAHANMIVDIGGGTTEIAVLALAGIDVKRSLRTAGDELDEAIIAYVKAHFGIQIGPLMAEKIKVELGSAWPLETELEATVKGQDLKTGLPRAATITSQQVREALDKPVSEIVGAVKATLQAAKPELAADLVDKGINLCGGGSLLRGMDKRISDAVGLPVKVADDPLTAVARGTGYVLDHLEMLKQILDTADDP